MKTAVFTIASRNYFGFARTLMDSLEKSNPNWERHVVVVDEISEEFEKISRNFDLISLDELNLPEKEKMIFRYTIMELNTAVKPFAIEILFEKKKYDRVIYIDPDIYVYKQMEEVENALDSDYNFVLTPHFTGLWEEDGKMPDEPAIMCAGVYNLGFIALNRSESTLEMIHWWEKKLEKHCVVAVADGIFVDQKWIDLVPGRYSDVYILRHEGYNVAYWNLSHRSVKKSDGQFFYNDQPLVFFHFSGLNPKDLSCLSKHSDRFYKHNLGDTMEVVEEYAKNVQNNDFESWKRFEYAFGHFKDGRSVNDLFRYAYRNSDVLQKACGNNPFEKSDIFYNEYRQEISVFLTQYLWKNRADLQAAFPGGCRSEEFLNWFKNGCAKDYNLPSTYFKGLNFNGKEHINWTTRFKMKMYCYLPDRMWNTGRSVHRKFKRIKNKLQSKDIQKKN